MVRATVVKASYEARQFLRTQQNLLYTHEGYWQPLGWRLSKFWRLLGGPQI